MSEDHGNDSNFNELVGNLLSSHNDPQHLNQNSIDDADHSRNSSITDNTDDQQCGIGSPGFGTEEEDLAAVVASAIENMNEQSSQANGSMELEEQEQHAEGVVKEKGNSYKTTRVKVRENEENEIDHEQNQEWATMLQQGLIQGHEHSQVQPEEQLDQDDETLRRAILESLQELNFRDKEDDIVEEPISRRKDKKNKTRKPSKKSSSSHSSAYPSKKKKDGKKKENRKVNDNDDDLLNFEDVIRGFMHPETTDGQNEPSASVEDSEIQALVEATLKAFERELLGPAGNAAKTTKKKSSHKRSDQKRKARTYTPLDLESNHDSSKNSKKKQQADSLEEPGNNDDFSKQLAEMVNQVVNTTASVEPASGVQVSEQGFTPSSQGANEDFNSQEIQASPPELVDGMSETFDLNEIMQRAMNMAFQEQEEQKGSEQQELETHVDRSTNKGFNHELNGLNVIDLDRELTTDFKSPFSDEDDSKITKDMIKHKKSTRSLEEKVRKKYSQVALSAAHAAKKRLSEKNKINKLKEKEERQKIREDKKSKKKKQQEKLEEERRELEEIVARGPPYPPDLRLTKSGKPKKPYRRWTTEELEKRAAVFSEEANDPSKEQKVGKKKSKKLKRVPLYNLKNIPIFQFIKSNVTNGARTRPGLNGIEDALTRIPLASNNLNLSGLVPANHTNLEQTTGGKGGDDTDGDLMPLILQCKTVVRREKIPLHPPWAIPDHPPFALPVARRRRKEKMNESASYDGVRNSATQSKSSDSVDVRNKILPAVLLPIFSALKAAARANAASGATSEESLQLLMNVIKHTKSTMAKMLESSDKTPSKESFMMKSQKGNVATRVRKRPIFSLANIRKIDTTNDEPRITSPENGKDSNIKTVALIKSEGVESSTVPILQETPTDKYLPLTLKRTLENEKGDHELMSPQGENGSAPVKQLSSNSDGNLANRLAFEQDKNGSTNGDLEVYPELVGGNGHTDNDGDIQLHEVRPERPPQEKDERTTIGTVSEKNAGRTAEKRPEENAIDKSKDAHRGNSEKLSEATQEKNEENSRILGKLAETKQESVAFEETPELGKGVLPGPIKDETNCSSVNAQVQAKKQTGSPRHGFEDLVKQQLVQSYGTHIDLPLNFGSIVSATLASLFLDLNGHKNNKEKEEARPEVRRYKKSPPPVLNLDGLVPPSGIQIVSKAVAQPVTETASVSPAPKLKRPRKKSEQPVLLHTFNVPNVKDIQGRRTMLLKRAKGYLNDEEMGILKREINKERKRKWREVNVEKNWEHDLRSRLKKRANVKYGESNSTEKNQWFENEVAKNLSERGIKQDDYLNNGNGKVGGRKNTGSTNLSDNEVLNMIATSLGKLDVARRLERELNELRKPNETRLSNLNKNEGTNIANASNGILDVGKNDPDIAEFKTVEETRSEKELDEMNQNRQLKRAYPDDIPLMVPILKKSKFLNAEGNS